MSTYASPVVGPPSGKHADVHEVGVAASGGSKLSRVSEPIDQSLITLELVGAAESENTERLLAQAIRRFRLPASYGIAQVPAGIAVASTSFDRLGQVLDVVDVVAEMLAGTDMRGKMVLHFPTGSAEDRLSRLFTAKVLDNAVRDTPPGGVAALVSEEFIDAYRNRPGATELSGYRRILVEARPTEIWAWLRTIPSASQESSAITALAVSPDGRLAVTVC